MFPNRFSMKICYIVNLIIRISICNINIDSILYEFHQNLNCLRELYLVNYCEPIDRGDAMHSVCLVPGKKIFCTI